MARKTNARTIKEKRKMRTIKLLFLCLLMSILILSLAACSKKGASFESLGGAEQLTQVKSELEIAKKSLVNEGEDYNCCINPTCNWCALFDNHCHCAEHLVKDEPVCPECVRGWRKGNGAVADIDPSKVKSAL
jgi:hypothetical protein